MKNHWLNKTKESELFETAEQYWERKLKDLSEYGEKELALYIIEKNKHDREFRDKVSDKLLLGKSLTSFIVDDAADFPKDDENSIIAGCCGNFACNCTANLDLYYAWHFMSNETLRWTRQNQQVSGIVFSASKKFILAGSMAGTIYANDRYGNFVAVQTFATQTNGDIEFKKLPNESNPSDHCVTEGYFNAEKGELKLLWSTWPQIQKVIASYEFNYEQNAGTTTNDASSLMQGDIYGGYSSLDIFYSSQYIHGEVYDYCCEYTPVIAGTMTGEIFLGDERIQTFCVSCDNLFTFSYDIPSPYSVVRGELNNTTGELTLTWENEPPVKPKVVINYEYNLEIPTVRTL